MASNNPHLLKKHSLFAMFCLSYLPLFFLLGVKVTVANTKFLHFSGFSRGAILLFLEKFGVILPLLALSLYAVAGTWLTIKNIKQKEGNAVPVRIESIKPKNEDALSYLGSYVIPLMLKGDVGIFEYCTLGVLFTIYFMIYSASGLILINPILNTRYGLYQIEYKLAAGDGKIKTAMVISNQKWVEEDDLLRLLKLSHKLYFAF